MSGITAVLMHVLIVEALFQVASIREDMVVPNRVGSVHRMTQGTGMVIFVAETGQIIALTVEANILCETQVIHHDWGVGPVWFSTVACPYLLVAKGQVIGVWKANSMGIFSLLATCTRDQLEFRALRTRDRLLYLDRNYGHIIALDDRDQLVTVPSVRVDPEASQTAFLRLTSTDDAYVVGDEYGNLVFAKADKVIRIERLTRGTKTTFDQISDIDVSERHDVIAVAQGLKRNSDLSIVSVNTPGKSAALLRDADIGQVSRIRFTPQGDQLVARGSRGIGVWNWIDGDWRRQEFITIDERSWKDTNSLEFLSNSRFITTDQAEKCLRVFSIGS